MQFSHLSGFLDIAEFVLEDEDEVVTFEIVRAEAPSPNKGFHQVPFFELLRQLPSTPSLTQRPVADLDPPLSTLTPCFYFLEGMDLSEDISFLDLECNEDLDHLIIEEEPEFSDESEEYMTPEGRDLLDTLEKKYQKILEKKVSETCHVDLLSSSTSVSGDRDTLKARDFEDRGFDENPGYFLQSRRDKVDRYIRKRRNRNWNKKISYKCRKEVADARLRVKGRFVTRTQANGLLGINTAGLSMELIRTLLENKFGREKEDSEVGFKQEPMATD